MDTLPRDAQLQIVKKFDMDTRIKTGIIGKLKVPEKTKELIQKVRIPKKELGTRYIVRIEKKRSFCMVISWDSGNLTKMVSIIRPTMVFDYWVADKDHTQWVYTE